MASKTISALKLYFETGDVPTEAQFADLIDSCLNLKEPQPLEGNLNIGDNNIINVGDISLDSITTKGNLITINLTDNQATALEIKEGSNSYMYFVTTNENELVYFSKRVQLGEFMGFGAGELINEFSADGTLSGNSDNAVPTESAVKTYVDAAGGAKPDLSIDYPAGKANYPISNLAPLDTDSGTNGILPRHLFDDSTEEFIQGVFKVPSDVNASGTVTIEIDGYAKIAVAGKNVEFTFYHSARTAGESWDATYNTKVSGDLACDADGGQDELDHLSFTETIANLGWAAGDDVRWKIGRTPPTTNNLSDDYGTTHHRIRIPRT